MANYVTVGLDNEVNPKADKGDKGSFQLRANMLFNH